VHVDGKQVDSAPSNVEKAEQMLQELLLVVDE
jgi:hypothetical protein